MDETRTTTLDRGLVHDLVTKCLLFLGEFCQVEFYPYQRDFAYRIFESLIEGDGDEVTGLMSRQSGKSETLANVVATAMVLFPRLADIYPELMGKYRKGLWVGTFAPVENQAETLFTRIVDRLTSERALEILKDEEINDDVKPSTRLIRLKRSGSFCRMQTANPKAKVESKSYHFIIIDEAQGADEYMVQKSIQPMGAHYNATILKIGTPDIVKGDFYKAIQRNKRAATKKGGKRNHFEYDWKHCAKYNENYRRYVEKEIEKYGEDSDSVRLSYKLEWLLDRGMFLSGSQFDELGDLSMQTIKAWHASPVVVGIDPARKLDSTVVTVVWVDWDRPDEFGYFHHRVLNWLELHGDQWEEQYFQIVDFLAGYKIFAVAVDSQGMGDVVADRLKRLLPGVEVVPTPSTVPEQAKRWKHLQELIQRGMVGWPAHANTRKLRTWRRFSQQMGELEKQYQGPHMLAAAPDAKDAHDDYPDSLALACILTKDFTMPTVEVSATPFFR